MGFKKSFLQILIRVLMLIIWVLGVFYTFFSTELIISPIMFGVLTVISVIELVWFLQRQERNWIRFLESVKYQDFNRIYHKQASNELQEAYELITQSMEELQSSNQAEYRLLQTVLAHISIGVLCYNDSGAVIFSNKSFDALLNISGLIHIDKLKNAFPAIYSVITKSDTNPTGWIDHLNGQKLFVKTESFKLRGVGHQLVSLTDIRSSLDAKELESYQKLMRVMTHEIMNSANPVLSLIKVVNKKMISSGKLNQLESNDQQKIVTSLQAIKERTSGILRFVTGYKEINRSVQPRLEKINSEELLQTIHLLIEQSPDIEFVILDNLKSQLHVDKALINQVLINLIYNAIEAISDSNNRKIIVEAKEEMNQSIIIVTDNGPGVPATEVHQIFVPFFTTKSEGSGVGLALSRKIVKAHGGSLEYERENEKTHFIIRLPKLK